MGRSSAVTGMAAVLAAFWGNRMQAALLCLLALVVSQPMLAQETAPGETDRVAARDTDFTFSLAKTIGQPGAEVSVAVLFARKTRAPNLSRIRVRVRYPSAVLKFDRVEDAYLSRRVNMRVQGKEDAGNASESVLELNLELPEAQTASYPSGQIASVYFKIAADAVDQIVPMIPQAWIDDSEVTPESSVAQIEPGQVQVSKDPVFVSCFFFAH